LWAIYCLKKEYSFKQKIPEEEKQVRDKKLPSPHSIMGKTKYCISHTEPNAAKQSHSEKGIEEVITFTPEAEKKYTARVDEAEFDEVFSNVPIEIEVDAKYDEEKMVEEDEIIALQEGGNLSVAQGVLYEQMSDVVRILQKDECSDEEAKQAASIINQISNTEIFEKLMIKIGSEAPSRVEAIFAKNEAIDANEAHKPFVLPERYEDFDFKNLF
jgi:hypothetical protein